MSIATKLQRARALLLFRRFQGRQPKKSELVEIGGMEKGAIALCVGNVVGISYKAAGDGEKYYHEFESPRPQLFVSADGKQILFVGGNYTFTERGFIK